MFRLSDPKIDILKGLLKESSSASYVELDKVSSVSDVTDISSDKGNTSATVHYTDGGSVAVIYNRIRLSDLFGVVFCSVRKGQVDWFDQAETKPRLTGRFYAEVNKLYGVDLDGHVQMVKRGDTDVLEAVASSELYHEETQVHTYSSKFNAVPINLLTGYDLVKYKGNYAIMPTNPYPVNSYLYTSDPDYDPNGDIFGEWEQDIPLVLSGDLFELMKLPVGFVFERLDEWVPTPHLKVICLDHDASVYNTGLATKMTNKWRVDLEDSILYGESFSEIRRDQMTTGIKVYMTIWKQDGYLANSDNPEYRHKRVK